MSAKECYTLETNVETKSVNKYNRWNFFWDLLSVNWDLKKEEGSVYEYIWKEFRVLKCFSMGLLRQEIKQGMILQFTAPDPQYSLWKLTMPVMGQCCQRSSEDKENLSYKRRWPNASRSARLSSDSSAPLNPRGSFNEILSSIPDEGEEEPESPLKSPGTAQTTNHLQVTSFILGHRKGSRTSTSSGRSSVASVLSVQSETQLPRMSSFSGRSENEEEDSNITEEIRRKRKPRRAVSLKLPSRYRRAQESDTKVPTIYIDDPPSRPTLAARRKSSFEKALSLLSLASAPPAEARPVQKILRQPTRRHHVRGISGLPIAAENTSMHYPHSSLHHMSRRQTVYYPTNAPVKTRRTSTGYYA